MKSYEEIYGPERALIEKEKRKKPKRGLSERDRFWKRVIKSDGCWFWTIRGEVRKNEYGRFQTTRGLISASRFVLEMKLGRPLITKMEACHTCDIPCCVNPAHLFEGTHQENMQDALRKGRLKIRTIRSRPEVAAKIDAIRFATAKKIRMARIANGTDKGWKHSEETRNKIREGFKRRSAA